MQPCGVRSAGTWRSAPARNGGDPHVDDQTVNVRYMVDDVDESIGFYTALLGFEVLTTRAPAFAEVMRGQPPAAARGPTSSAGRPMPDGREPGPGGWNRIHFIVDDIEAEVERLRAAGAQLPQRHRRGPGRQADPARRPVGQPRRAVPAGRVITQRHRVPPGRAQGRLRVIPDGLGEPRGHPVDMSETTHTTETRDPPPPAQPLRPNGRRRLRRPRPLLRDPPCDLPRRLRRPHPPRRRRHPHLPRRLARDPRRGEGRLHRHRRAPQPTRPALAADRGRAPRRRGRDPALARDALARRRLLVALPARGPPDPLAHAPAFRRFRRPNGREGRSPPGTRIACAASSSGSRSRS